MNRKLAVGLCLVVVAVGAWFAVREMRPTSATSGSSAVGTQDPQISSRSGNEARTPSSVHDGQASSPAAAKVLTPAPEFKYGAELTQYVQLKGKVFATADDKAQRARLLGNRDFLRAMEPLLSHAAALGSKTQQQQDEATHGTSREGRL